MDTETPEENGNEVPQVPEVELIIKVFKIFESYIWHLTFKYYVVCGYYA